MSDDERMDRAERIRRMREGDSAETTETEPAVADETTNGDGSDDAEAPESTDAMAAAQRAAEASTQIAESNGESATVDEPTDSISASTTPMQGPTGVDLPDQELLESAMSSADATRTEGGARAAAVDEESTQSEELARVLEFALGDEYYCLDIDYVEEIVKRDTITRVPNTDDYVEGVVDLRGQITTILDPKEMVDIESEGTQNLIVVFDAEVFEDQGAIGWNVDEVRQVVPLTESEVNDSPVDGSYINGVVDRDGEDEFTIWIEPEDVLDDAIGTDED